jgi:hypothetical protein
MRNSSGPAACLDRDPPPNLRKPCRYVAGNMKRWISSALAQSEAPAGKMRVMFTFDDGWMDNYTNALPVARSQNTADYLCLYRAGRTHSPILARVGHCAVGETASPPVPARKSSQLIELLKTYSGAPRQLIWPDALRHAPSDPPQRNAYNGDRTVSWDDIREMDAAGVRFGCHTHTHQILPNVPAQTARQEIRESKHAIEAALYTALRHYSPIRMGTPPRQPGASWPKRASRAAFTTERGAWTSGSDPMAIPRSECV